MRSVRQLSGSLRSPASDVSTAAGRSRERYRRIVLSAAAGIGGRAISILTGIVLVPITLRYLGTDRYGLLVVITSITGLIGFSDLGMGNGLLNAISRAHGADDRLAARRAVSSALALLTGVALAIGAGFALAYPFTPWHSLFNVSTRAAAHEAGPAVAVFVGCLLLNMPAGIVQRVQLGYQDGFVSAIWGIAGNVLALAAALSVISLHGGLIWLVLAINGAPLLANLVNGFVLFRFQRPWLWPDVTCISRRVAWQILNTGLLFFVLQIAVAVAYETDNVVIARVLGAEHVPQYSIPFRLFTIPSMLLWFLLTPLWPAYGEAIARGDSAWVRSALRRSLLLGAAISAPCLAVLVVAAPYLLRIWVGSAIHPSTGLLIGLALWSLLTCLISPVAVLMNGSGFIKFQVVCALFNASANLVLSVVLTRKFGVAGPVYGSLVAHLLFATTPLVLYLPRLLRRIDNLQR